LTFQENN
jgi:hypothetical protein